MPSTKDIKPDPSKLLFIGPNGRGKTLAWASLFKILPPGVKIYCFDFDGRMAPIRMKYPEADIEFDTYGPSNFLAFRTKILGLVERPSYGAIILDSVTSCSLSAINYQLKIKGDGAKKVSNLPVTSWDEINGETILFSQALDVLKMYPGIVVVTAHPVDKMTIVEGSAPIKTKELVAYGPKIGSLIPNYFNEIYSFYKETNVDPNLKAKYYVRTNDEIAKTSFDLPGQIGWTGEDFFPILHKILREKGIDITTIHKGGVSIS